MPDLVFPELGEILELLPPAGAALALFLLGAWLSRRGSPAWVTVASVLAIGVAYTWTFTRLRGAPAFPPRLSTERGLWAVLIAGGLALVPAARRLRLLPAIVAAPIVVVWVAGGPWSETVTTGRLVVIALGAIAYFVLLDRAALCPGALFGFVAAFAFGASGQVFLMFRSALLAQLAGALALSSGLIGLAALFFRRPVPASITVPLGAIVAALSLDSALFSYGPPPSLALVLLAAAPLAPLAAFRGKPDCQRPLVCSLAAAALSLALTGAGFYVAWRVAPPSFG